MYPLPFLSKTSKACSIILALLPAKDVPLRLWNLSAVVEETLAVLFAVNRLLLLLFWIMTANMAEETIIFVTSKSFLSSSLSAAA